MEIRVDWSSPNRSPLWRGRSLLHCLRDCRRRAGRGGLQREAVEEACCSPCAGRLHADASWGHLQSGPRTGPSRCCLNWKKEMEFMLISRNIIHSPYFLCLTGASHCESYFCGLCGLLHWWLALFNRFPSCEASWRCGCGPEPAVWPWKINNLTLWSLQ